MKTEEEKIEEIMQDLILLMQARKEVKDLEKTIKK